MHPQNQHIHELLTRVRARWRRLTVFQATLRASLGTAGVLTVALFLTYWTARAPIALAALAIAALALVVAVLIWGFWPAREAPSDARVARFIEEREPSLDDRLVSAVDVATAQQDGHAPGLAGPMVADAGRRASKVDPDAIVPGHRLRRAAFQAAAAALLVLAIAFFGRDTARQSMDAVSLMLFPSRVNLAVTPGNTRIQAGSPLTIEARLVGNRAPVVAQVLTADATEPGSESAALSGDEAEWRTTEMATDPAGAFRLALESVGASFRYRVVAGTLTSPVYEVSVVRAPRVTRIDVEYRYPSGLGLQPRIEEDSGDIYAPAGTDVRILVHADRDASAGRMTLGDGKTIDLTAAGAKLLSGALKVEEDGSYRVALVDRDGLSNPGDTEYFIRTLEDRAPEVRIVQPGRDRGVTRLEEVDIEAQAEDDFGIDRLELVYAVRGSAEKAVPLSIPRRATSVTGTHTLYLEDLNVQPGDFVSYYVRARDLARGKRASEARSDIFFLEVKPFEQEFTLAQSQAMAGGGGNRSLDDLVSAQKEIIVATWKLDRRAQAARGARSEQDIRAVSRAEAELKTRVEETSSSFRESVMRDPRRRQPQPGRGGAPPQPGRGGLPPQPGRGGTAPQPDVLRAGQTMPEEDAMTAAALAMGKAVDSLDALKTGDALPPEMEALNQLLKAQADVKKRQVTRQQAGAGGGGNRTSQDLSSLFDKELQRQQQTNYETPTSTERRDDSKESMLDKIKELARRQDELLKRQQELAAKREAMSAEEMKRQLEMLTREQSELRQRAEEMARQMASQQSQSGQQNQSGQQPQPGQQSQSGQQRQPGQGQGQSGQGQSGQQAGGSNPSRQMRDVSEEMRNAASDLRRQDPAQATSSGNRALEKLQELARQMQAAAPDEQRRALGDMQLEARQLADAQRQVASELGKVGSGETGKDAMRRLAGEEERLAERTGRLQEGLRRQGATPGDPRNKNAASSQRAAAEASREIERQRLAERMRESADQMRAAAAPADGRSAQASSDLNAAKAAAGGQQEMARALDRLADKLAGATGPDDQESRKLTDQLARAQELRERIEGLTRELQKLGEQNGQSPNSPGSQGSPDQNSSGSRGQPGERQASQAQAAGAGPGGDVARLRDEYNRQLQETRALLDQLRREDETIARGGLGFTFEGQGMVLSAPGTEAFKQDFAKWDELRKQVTLALEQAETSLSQKLQARQSRDRLAAGVDDKVPAAYQEQVDSYFKALATQKKR